MVAVFQDIKNGNWSTNKTLAVVFWCGSAFLTASLLMQLSVPMKWAIGIGVLFQTALTKAQRPIFRDRKFTPFGVTSVGLDTVINGAGAYVYVRNIGKTDFWLMVKDVTGQA